ncbi:hypothetical protein [Rhodococcus pyridinivorans]|uniref:hypothetical protein n=1 Tax=Rhodococcus pyridinivorans TaxID=103816 RepID=UPI002659C587|nr:hypothetical protein [Rhodococcus pyridinivorans]
MWKFDTSLRSTSSSLARMKDGRLLSEISFQGQPAHEAGLGEKAVLELDPDEADLPRHAKLGHKVFTSVGAFLGFLNKLHRESASIDSDEAAELPAEPGTDLESEFGSSMRSLYEWTRRETGLNAGWFICMVASIGAVATAKEAPTS